MKVRFHTWYWGNYCLAKEGATLPWGLEPYSEEQHGWKNSIEWKEEQRPEYIPPDYRAMMLEEFLQSSFYKSCVDENDAILIVNKEVLDGLLNNR